MKSPLIPIDILSCYTTKFGDRIPLPPGMARCTPDTYTAIVKTAAALADQGGKLVLSDLFRSYDMQAQSHQDYVSGRKKAFSPPPGGSFHEAGRGFDLDLDSLKISLADFWEIAERTGLKPIIATPNKNQLEAWHFDCRGSHDVVYQYYRAGKANNLKPYTAAAASAILSAGIKVDTFGNRQIEATIQSCIIRLGKDIGAIDGYIGRKTQQALEELNVPFDPSQLDRMLIDVENMIQKSFPQEFQIPTIEHV